MLDDILWPLSLLWLWALVAPLWALRSANAARQRIVYLEQHAAWLQSHLVALESAFVEVRRAPHSVFRAAPQHVENVHGAAREALSQRQLTLGFGTAPTTTSESACESSPTVASAPSPAVASVASHAATTLDGATPLRQSTGDDADVAAHAPRSVEERLGLHGLTRIGAAVFLVGALLFLGHAVEQDWIGPVGRVGLGLGLGAGLLGLAHVLAEKSRPVFIVAIRGLGLSLLFASIWMSSNVYGLVAPAIALLGQVGVLGLGAVLAVRHRAEGILIWSMVCGFATPWISNLSPGLWDTAAYVFVLTAVVFGVSARLGFRVAPWLALGGTCASAAWAGATLDLVAYEAGLADRADVIFAAVAFAGQWLFFTRRHAVATLGSEAGALFGVVVASLATVGAATLAWGHPHAVIVGLVATSAAVMWALRDAPSRAWLWWPLGIGFFCLLAIAAEPAPAPIGSTWITLAGAWAALHAWGLGMRLAPRDGATRPRLVVDPIVSAPLAMWWVLSATALGDEGRVEIVWLSALAVLLIGAVGRTTGARWQSPLAVLATGLAALLVAVVAPGSAAGDPSFLLALAAWFVAAAAVALERFVLAERSEALPIALDVSPAVTWALATLGAEVALFAATADQHRLLRSAVLGAGAILGFTCAALLYLQRRAASETLVRVALALAVAQLAVAIALLWAGAVVTVLWAALGATLVTLGTREGARLWLGGGLTLLGASLVRMIMVDVVASQSMVDTFLQTGGASGALPLPVLAHPQAHALLGVGAALLVAARALRKHAALVQGGVVATVLGLCLLIALGLTEVRSALLDTSALGVVGSDYGVLRAQLAAAEGAQAALLAVSSTLVLAGFALAVLAAGFATRDDLYRRLGLGLFGIAAAKMGILDVWSVDPAARIGLLLGVGALLVVGGFLYARFAAALLTRTDETEGAGGAPSV